MACTRLSYDYYVYDVYIYIYIYVLLLRPHQAERQAWIEAEAKRAEEAAEEERPAVKNT